MVTYIERPRSSSHESRDMARRLDAAAWGMFFVWVGYALLAQVSIGVGLLGVGVVTLLGQAARKTFSLPFEGFWFLVGLCFVVGGLWNIYALEVPLAPVLLVGLGAILLIRALLIRGTEDDEEA